MKHSFTVNFPHAAKRVYWDYIQGSKTKWILEAMAQKYTRETGKNAHQIIEGERRRLDAIMDEFDKGASDDDL